jgi:3-hydroxybutyryl-CoA dehydratase
MSALEPGLRLGPLVVDPVDPGAMKVVAILQDDPNPIHWDPTAAARVGLGDRVVNQGPITVSYLLELASRAAGGHAGVLRLDARFVRTVFAGDRVECCGVVMSVDLAAGTAELELNGAVDGHPVVSATATISVTAPGDGRIGNTLNNDVDS